MRSKRSKSTWSRLVGLAPGDANWGIPNVVSNSSQVQYKHPSKILGKSNHISMEFKALSPKMKGNTFYVHKDEVPSWPSEHHQHVHVGIDPTAFQKALMEQASKLYSDPKWSERIHSPPLVDEYIMKPVNPTNHRPVNPKKLKEAMVNFKQAETSKSEAKKSQNKKMAMDFTLPKFTVNKEAMGFLNTTPPEEEYESEAKLTYKGRLAAGLHGYLAIAGQNQKKKMQDPEGKIDLIGSGKPFSKSTHKPVLDIDLPVHVTPSATPGHNHVFVDKEMSWTDYKKLLTVLTEVGIIEPGYLKASKIRGFTAVAPGPWKKSHFSKGESSDNS